MIGVLRWLRDRRAYLRTFYPGPPDYGMRDRELSAATVLKLLTNAERACITADEFAVLKAWSQAAPSPNYGECATCGTVNAAQVRL